jgi:REP element-mobilizing transposase RayT
MPRPLLNRLATVRQGAFLPHWTATEATYHVVFRLADALPAEVVRQYQGERDALLLESGNSPSPAIQDRLDELFSEKIEYYLDSGRGECWLARDDLAQIVSDALSFFDGRRYRLHAWCVMPNHVHVVASPLTGRDLAGILHSWKSFTASEINAIVGRAGAFWQKESYDHIVRDADEFATTVRYVQENPTKAGLKAWRWVWPEARNNPIG